jgi:hypothetical protein
MKEESIFYESGSLQLEGLYAKNNGNLGAVICHPHPLMGGSMQNNVVVAMITSLFAHGFSTLRFNFRGVGRSSGNYDNGVGEQDDISGAVSWMRQKGKTSDILAAYSFGAWVSAKWLQSNQIEHPAILVSPPIDVMDFDFSALTGKVGLIVCAEKDQFCDCERIKDIAHCVKCRFELIPDTDHFYFGSESGIVAAIHNHFDNIERENR